MASATDSLKRTPLHSTHVEWGAKLVGFGGWEMPVQYSSIVEEHAAVRQRVGLFDISHMGEVVVAGPAAETVLNHLLTNDVRALTAGQAQYTLLCNEQGGIIDDLIVYRLEPSVFLLVINASHIDHDFQWMSAHATAAAVFDNASEKLAALALQGPAAAAVLPAAADLKPFHLKRPSVGGVAAWVARTGYTGEDGFEIICDAKEVRQVWTGLMEAGQAHGIKPCGLGARDVLRLEMCYPLHGNDISENTTPLEAGLGRFVSFDKGEFLGRERLLQQRETGVDRKLVAFRMTDKAPPPRPHYGMYHQAQRVGEVTSGTPSPALQTGIGMGYVATAAAAPGTKLEIEIRGRMFPATIEKKPLLKRGS